MDVDLCYFPSAYTKHIIFPVYNTSRLQWAFAANVQTHSMRCMYINAGQTDDIKYNFMGPTSFEGINYSVLTSGIKL